MDLENRLKISYYETIATINEAHQIYVVQHRDSKKVCIKKVMDIYNKSIYEDLMEAPICGIPKIFALYEDNNSLTCIEEYISGDTLQDILDKGIILSEEVIIQYTQKLCSILEHLHMHNPPIIHRDIKPSNIIITSKNDLYLIDLNAAKYYSDGSQEDTILIGTHGFAAPEQYGFGSSSAQTDIYSIGILIKTLCTGSPSGSISQNSPLAHIAAICTRIDPAERYKSIAELKTALSDNSGSLSPSGSIRAFLPPGFRSNQPSHMIVASIVYAGIIYLCATLELKDTTAQQLIVEKVGLFLVMISFILCAFNYLNIQSRSPFNSSDSKILRIAGKFIFSIFVPFIILFATFLITSLL